MKTYQLMKILAAHKTWLDHEDGGAQAELAGADLTGADLTGADLAYANLAGANLAGANLTGADLMNAYLSDAKLAGANLNGARLVNTDMRGADLRDANLILIGQDARGYQFYGYTNDNGVLEIHAGCRHFVGMDAVRAYLEHNYPDDPVLRADRLSLVERAEDMARARGWKLEPEQEGRRD